MNTDKLFGIIIYLDNGVRLYIHAWESQRQPTTSHTQVDIEAFTYKNGKKTEIFARGFIWVGIPAHQSIDGKAARRSVLSCVAMKPGDADSQWFASYSPEQLEFVDKWGDHLSAECESRYGQD